MGLFAIFSLFHLSMYLNCKVPMFLDTKLMEPRVLTGLKVKGQAKREKTLNQLMGSLFQNK